ncbi:MAG: hypothetical protein HKP18_12785 [Acidimicrobiia bacterium]|nr:hypothetical protein [Acidimicrobiia bacterium]
MEAQVAADKELRAALPNPLSHLTTQVADRLTFPESDDPEVRRLAALKALEAETELK